MKPKEFDKFLRRDRGSCYHCGAQSEDLIPHHRGNRQMGGKNSKADQPANIIVMCAEINGLMESDPAWAATARVNGWKLKSFEDPTFKPVYEAATGSWWILENDFSRHVAIKY